MAVKWRMAAALAVAVAGLTGAAWADAATDQAIAALAGKIATGTDLEKANAYLSRAQKYIQEDKFAQAIADCQAALALAQKLKATLGPIYVVRARAEMFKGDRDAALADYQRGLTTGGDKWTITWGMGYTHYLDKAFGLSVDEFAEAVKIDPTKAMGWRWLGETKFAMGDWEGAMAAGKKAHEVDPKAYREPTYDQKLAVLNGAVFATGKAPAMRARADYFLARGVTPADYAAALAGYDDIIQRHLEATDDFAMRAWLRIRVAQSLGSSLTMAERKLIDADLAEALRRDARCGRALYVRGRLQLLENEDPETWSGKAKEDDTDDEGVIGLASDVVKRAHGAVADLQAAAEALPRIGAVHFWAARAERALPEPNIDHVAAQYAQAIEADFSALPPADGGALLTPAAMATEAWLFTGKIQGIKGDWQAVIESTRHVLELDSEHAEALKLQATGYVQTKAFKEALGDLRVAIAVTPDDPDALFMRALCRDNLQQYRLAQADLRAAVRNKPALAERLKGSRYENLNATLPPLAVAEPKTDANAERLKEKAEALFRKKDFAGAIAAYTLAVEDDPGYADAFDGRGQAEVELQKWDDALVDFDRAIALVPTEPGYFTDRAHVHEVGGRKYRELSDSAAAVELMKERPPEEWSSGRLIRLGLCEQSLRRFDEGSAHLEEAHKMDPLTGYSAISLALCYAARGKAKESQELVATGLKDASAAAVQALLQATIREREEAQRTMDAGIMVVSQYIALKELELTLKAKTGAK